MNDFIPHIIMDKIKAHHVNKRDPSDEKEVRSGDNRYLICITGRHISCLDCVCWVLQL